MVVLVGGIFVEIGCVGECHKLGREGGEDGGGERGVEGGCGADLSGEGNLGAGVVVGGTIV